MLVLYLTHRILVPLAKKYLFNLDLTHSRIGQILLSHRYAFDIRKQNVQFFYMNQSENPPKKSQENLLANIAFNVVLPVMILDQLSKRLGVHGPTIALFVALAFPIGYGLFDFISRGEKNLLSAFGVINVLFTGGLALLKVEGFWFAVKEAAFPLIIGIFVFATSFTQKPAVKFFFINPAIMNVDLVLEKISALGHEIGYEKLLKNSTILLATSFFLSALLNYILARWIFTDIDATLSEAAQNIILNDQIKKMTYMGYLVIALPLTVFMIGILLHFIKNLRELTQLTTEEIMPMMAEPKKESQ